MKPKTFSILVIVFLVLVIGGAFWVNSRTPEFTATATLTVTPVAKANAPKAASPVAQVELPKAAAVGAKEGVGSQEEAISLAQAEARTTVLEMARTIREKGAFAAELAYLPPDEVARISPEHLQFQQALEAKWMEDPQQQQRFESKAERYDYLATLTPTINSACEIATASACESAVPSFAPTAAALGNSTCATGATGVAAFGAAALAAG